MTRNERWELVVRICEETKDEVITSVRVALLNDFGKVDRFSSGNHARELAKCFRSFLIPMRRAQIPQVEEGRMMILFPFDSASNVQNLLPVAREAKRRGTLGGIVAGDDFRRGGSRVLSEFGPVIGERELHSLVGIGFFPAALRRARVRLKKLIARLEASDAHCALRARQNWASYIRLMVESEKMALAFRQLLSAWKPSVLFSTSDFWPFDFQCCWQAKARGIPSVIVQHGVINDVCAWPIYHDLFVAWGEAFREQLESKGGRTERIRILGMPASDELFQKASTQAERTTDPVCLIFSHTHDRVEESALFEEYGRCLSEAIQSDPGIKWKIKLHPAEGDEFYRETGIANFQNVEMVAGGTSLDKAVAEASVAMTIRSTAGLQAMMLNRPVVIFYPHMLKSPPTAWPEKGGGTYARTAADLVKAVRQLTKRDGASRVLLESQEKYLARNFANRGRSASAIVDFLEELGVPAGDRR
jgi:hypothetical protein